VEDTDQLRAEYSLWMVKKRCLDPESDHDAKRFESGTLIVTDTEQLESRMFIVDGHVDVSSKLNEETQGVRDPSSDNADDGLPDIHLGITPTYGSFVKAP
jgi:hypothetical protein